MTRILDYITLTISETGNSAPAYRSTLQSSKLSVAGPLLSQYSSMGSSLWHLTRQIFWVPHFSQVKRWTQLWPTAALISTPPSSDVCPCCQPTMHSLCSKHHSAHMIHTMHSSPCANHPAIAEYKLVMKGICAITNLDLSDL